MKTIKIHLISFASLLIISGVTAFPIQTEINYLFENRNVFPEFMILWIEKLYTIIHQTPEIMFYGTDWLAFAHIIIAMFFIPVFIDPFKYKVNLVIAMIACILVFPLAFICGPIRGIPFFHQLIDCSFGLIGIAYLYFIYYKINQLNRRS